MNNMNLDEDSSLSSSKYLLKCIMFMCYVYVWCSIHIQKKNKKKVIDPVLVEDFEVFIWLGTITMVIVYNVTMIIILFFITYHFRCVDPVFLLHKSI